ncbi:MAG: hypothetical protein ACR2QO_14150 [Acidimicrobiales bacterium]
MFLWFVIVAPIAVAEVFRSPMVDYRFVAIGAALPLVEVALGQPVFAHSLLAPVLGLGLVMAFTRNRRLLRRRLLGIPIGMFLHLVLDGTWTNAELFWWPAFGIEFGEQTLPELDRSVLFGAVLEVLALVLGFVAWRRYGLDASENRRLLWREGHLARSVFR